MKIKSFPQFIDIRNSDEMFEKWYSWKTQKQSLDEVFTEKQYWTGFQGFIKKDKQSPFHPKQDSKSNSKSNGKIPYYQEVIEEFNDKPKPFQEAILSISDGLSYRFYCNIDKYMVYVAVNQVANQLRISLTEVGDFHNEIMKKYKTRLNEASEIRLRTIEQIVNFYISEYAVKEKV